MVSKRFLRVLLALAAVGVLAASAFPGSASASHARYLNIAWAQTGVNTVDFTFTGGFRRCGYGGTAPDGCPAVGDVIFEGIGGTALSFGDFSSTGTLSFRVTAINTAEDWLLGQALDPNRPAGNNTDVLIGHTYSGPGPWNANASGCCTIFALNNNSSGAYAANTLVNLTVDQESPVSSIPPIVTVGNSGTQMWPVPAIDSGGETLRWRLATGAEACGGCSVPNPAGMTINANTGIVSWDTTGVAMGLWFTSVVIEALGPTGAVVSTTQVTYLVQVAQITTNQPPDWVTPPTPAQGTIFTVNVGATVTFALQASDPNAGDTVHIDHLGLPPGATLGTTDGNPATAMFSWTPSAGQEGDYLVTFTARDNGTPQLSAVARTVVIRVQSDGPTPDCGDIVDLSATWDSATDRIRAVLTLAAPSCPDVVYDVFIYANEGDTAPIGGQGRFGNGSPVLEFNGSRNRGLRVNDADGVVWLCAVSWRPDNGREDVLDHHGYPNAPASWECHGLRLERS